MPLYSNAAGTIPIVEALIGKGLPMGSVLAFMMAITALSFPEMVILRRVMKPQLIAVFVGRRRRRDPVRRLPVQRPVRLTCSRRSQTMKKIEVLGPGCANCQRLEKNAREAVEMAGVEAEITKVTDYGEIMASGS